MPLELPSLAAGQRENWLGRWAMNQMLINVSTRRFRRSVRLPDGDVAPGGGGTGTGTEVEVDYQPPRGNRLEEKDRFPTEVRLDKSITNEQRFQALADPNSRTEGFTAPGEHSSLDLLYDTFCSRCQ
jgi:hypothetical protein